jgi:hypothetical protein
VFNASIIPDSWPARNKTLSGSLPRIGRADLGRPSVYCGQAPQQTTNTDGGSSATPAMPRSGVLKCPMDPESGPLRNMRFRQRVSVLVARWCSRNAPVVRVGSWRVPQAEKGIGGDLVQARICTGRELRPVPIVFIALGLTSNWRMCRIVSECTPSDGGLECPLRR